MESGLEDIWSRLKLTEDEETVTVFEEEVPQEKVEEIELSLLGKLLTTHNFNMRVMKMVFKSIWKPSKGMIVREMDENLFLFQFWVVFNTLSNISEKLTILVFDI